MRTLPGSARSAAAGAKFAARRRVGGTPALTCKRRNVSDVVSRPPRSMRAAAESDSERPKTVGSRRPRTVGSRRSKRKPRVPFYKLAMQKIDAPLILGDVWMLSATQMSTQLIEPDDSTPLLALAVAIWLVVSALRGDYDFAEREDEDAPFLVGWSVVTGVLDACFSWACYTVLLLAVLSLAVSHGMLDAAPVLTVDASSKVSPVLEVQIALLITMTAWRGFYYGLREGLV